MAYMQGCHDRSGTTVWRKGQHMKFRSEHPQQDLSHAIQTGAYSVNWLINWLNNESCNCEPPHKSVQAQSGSSLFSYWTGCRQSFRVSGRIETDKNEL